MMDTKQSKCSSCLAIVELFLVLLCSVGKGVFLCLFSVFLGVGISSFLWFSFHFRGFASGGVVGLRAVLVVISNSPIWL